MLRLALAHLVQTLGEAARHVSPEFRAAHPEVPWAKVIGMRNRVVHDYRVVDYDIVWAVVATNLPVLVHVLARLIPRSGESGGG